MADGSKEIVQNDLKKGDAEDNHDSAYNFVYKNHAAFNVSPESARFVSVEMTDSFSLKGHGLHMHVGFHLSWGYKTGWRRFFSIPSSFCLCRSFVSGTIDGINPAPGVTDWQQLSTQGDVFHCDPT